MLKKYLPSVASQPLKVLLQRCLLTTLRNERALKESREQCLLAQAFNTSDTKVAVDERAHQDTADDGAGNRRQRGVPEIRLGHVQILTDDRDHRRSRESGDEGDEKSNPGHVEGHVVRSLEREDVQRHRLVFPIIFFNK